MADKDKGAALVPTEFRVSSAASNEGTVGILSIETTGGPIRVALDSEAAAALAEAIARLQTKLERVG
ncbi:hypothetical protein [Mesorhizobium sp.]|uniref:hypothetical protein n=1 Tax=Mesorhizobium sp. TaxID=1871066 RepID=UPI000FE62EDA|nr:hypothetical protein [Mesorhizobium sp.]RWG02537.1 MAG: hypothetical protein EOQ54_19480 [Mesorhizobium sp.]RWH00832.1 MAG: hypothetical protein EOQ72_09540 [Mesorhizobium sp.]TIR88868.1 MAG: hypothetical protein E5X08_29935 [Mesorhizobium sp.]TIS02456.1 MAG: hypothetical protein E5X13_10160 [Mesorhizobium sp.]